MKLRSKEGWAYFITEERNGRVLEFFPVDDPFITRKQLKKVQTRPHPFLLYAGRLKQVFDEAGRDIISMRVKSCYSLNVNPSKELYISDANLLEYIGKYEIIGTTGIDKWIYTQEDAPPCKLSDGPHSREGMLRRSREAYMELYKDAHIKMSVELDDWDRPRRRVVHETVDPITGQTVKEPAYVWNVL